MMSTVEKWKVIISGGRFVVLDATGAQVTAHYEFWWALQHAKEIAIQRGVEIQISASFAIKL